MPRDACSLPEMRSSRRITLAAALAALGYALLRGRLRRYAVAEVSMSPTLEPGDYIIAQSRNEAVQRGDIIVFDHPHRPSFELVKRVIGLPGESVEVSGGQVHCNDATVAEPWADGPTLPEGSWQLEPGEVFVLGDNRSASAADSRTLGPIPIDETHWKVVARYWPIRSAGRL